MKVKLIDLERVNEITHSDALFTLGEYYEVLDKDLCTYYIKSDNGYLQHVFRNCFIEVKDYIIF